ncbi:hypothetical protein MLP_52730 [Microlunatus phosphovorus NM-1]|uniref:IrrE N-terminal-like domain-containing protein n=1 Tax=Microlunatus phosphovorus (strain ATCC 700054 / DSM 10555 / JCM 9379 / NBRC 101784 / NCIMB 13414 / VKM Ac-1990 / NM-1) TaxID=1032480 RepID=F5XIP9_MICPN|nr:ImmA/IrrE family metallo-endopeptidase [Microlunatus phosphovorus]BAK38287.1 hypothetical protein MLP_52730 [Microlunatus phosphovorus NM-1]
MTSKAALHRLAADVRAEIGLVATQPFDPEAWSEQYGVPIVKLSALQTEDEAVGRFLGAGSARWSAALLPNGTGQVVVYNDSHEDPRIRSDLAHEAAHVVAEHVVTLSWTTPDGRCSGWGKTQENEAAELAGALLIPPQIAQRSAMRGVPTVDLAQQYGVSVQMAQWRMSVSGGALIADRARRKRRSSAG